MFHSVNKVFHSANPPNPGHQCANPIHEQLSTNNKQLIHCVISVQNLITKQFHNLSV